VTHLTFSVFRKGAREPALTLSSFGPAQSFPTPYSMAAAAISRHHKESPAAALRHLERTVARSAYWGSGGPATARGWAKSIVACFRRYQSMDEADGRQAFAWSLNLGLVLPPDDLAVHVDAVLFDPGGYVGRLALWDTPPLTKALASVYAAPAFRSLEEELGAGRITGVQVWHLRSGAAEFIEAAAAAGAVPLAERIVHRVAG
jgi:hypothetical protein